MHNSKGIIDFHAHILPGADHGSGSVETSLFQLNSALSFGVNRIIATPHFYPHRHSLESFLQRREKAYNDIRPHIPGGMEIKLGAEVLICPGIQRLPDIEKLFIEGSNSLLLELPFDSFDVSYCESVKDMRENGIDVILAHADRYSVSAVEQMLEAGARLQLNASSLTRLIKRKSDVSWLKNGDVIALGSDIHHRDKLAYRDFVRAVSFAGERADYIKNKSDEIWNQK